MRTRYQREVAEKADNKKPLTADEWHLTKKYFGYCCAYCGAKTKLEKDHLIALSHKGKTTLENIIPACRSCNARKNAQSFEYWYKRQPFFDKQRLGKIYAFFVTSGLIVNAGKYHKEIRDG